MTMIYVDADGCAVKDEVCRVALRYKLPVRFVANRSQRYPNFAGVDSVVVGGNFDAADNWIVEHVAAGDIVITADIPLAGRCIEKGAAVLGPSGREFTENSIGNALASRAVAEHMRQMGIMTGGPPPMADKDRSRFMARLDEIINALRRKG